MNLNVDEITFRLTKETNRLLEIVEDDIAYFSERNITNIQPVLLNFYYSSPDGQEKFIGFVEFDLRVLNKNAYITYYLKKEYRGKGIGAVMVKKSIKFAFRELNLNRVTAEVYEYNDHSIKLLKKLGFKEEGRIRNGKYHNSRFWDIIIYGLLRTEYIE